MTAEDRRESARSGLPATGAPTLVVATEAPPIRGGMQRWLTGLVGAYAATRPVVVVADDAADATALREAGATAFYPISDLRGRLRSDPGGVARETVAIARREGADRAHLAQSGLGFLARPMRSAGLDCVLTIHGNDLLRPWIGPGASSADRMARIRTCIRDLPRVQAVSRYGAARAREAGACGSVTVVPPSVDATRWTPGDSAEARRRLGLPEAAIVLLTVGRPVRRKGHDHIADAIARLPGDVHWVVAGQPTPQTSDAVTVSLPTRGRFHERYAVSDAMLLDLYRAADLFVLAPYERDDARGRSVEGFGIVFLEAAACELPVVSTRSGGVPDAVADGETGVLVSPRDPAALADAIARLLSDATRRRRLGVAARVRAMASFSPDALAERLARDELPSRPVLAEPLSRPGVGPF